MQETQLVAQRGTNLAYNMEAQKPVWEIDISHASINKFDKFEKKHGREYDALFANLDRIVTLLRSGLKTGGFQVGFYRSEGGGVFRIGQTRVEGAKESRLYVYPDEEQKQMYVLGIGTKDTQAEDIQDAKEKVVQIRKEVKQ